MRDRLFARLDEKPAADRAEVVLRRYLSSSGSEACARDEPYDAKRGAPMLTKALQTAAALATRGVPAIRAAISGARLGAGARFAASTLETLGIRVVSSPTTAQVARQAPVEAIMSAAGGAPLLSIVAVRRSGIALRLLPTGGVAATVSEEIVSAAARSTVRGALMTIGRATAIGAFGGAAIDAVLAGIAVAPGLRAKTVTGREAAMRIGKRALRGAVAGGAGVVAAGAVSAAVAATGLTLASAPVVVPLVAMVGVGAYASRVFDRRFGT